MGFSAKQIQALRRNIDQRHIRKREANGRELAHIEGWYAISEANRIFGFDGWNRETIDSKCVLTRENRGTFLAIYIARVRITVQADAATVVREGHGTGQGHGSSPGEVHDIAFKAAETDATKRALTTFGKPFGLALYRAGKATPAPRNLADGPKPTNQEGPESKIPASQTTPTTLHSSNYSGHEEIETHEKAQGGRQPAMLPSADTPIVPPPPYLVPGKIDKSLLTISESKRLRNKTHLRFVAAQPCLICGRQPSDAHHLRFAQPRALSLKVSDEFTVPLCRGHHRQLHEAGNEAAWWEDLDVNALEIAKGLWEESHGRSDIIEPKTLNSGVHSNKTTAAKC